MKQYFFKSLIFACVLIMVQHDLYPMKKKNEKRRSYKQSGMIAHDSAMRDQNNIVSSQMNTALAMNRNDNPDNLEVALVVIPGFMCGALAMGWMIASESYLEGAHSPSAAIANLYEGSAGCTVCGMLLGKIGYECIKCCIKSKKE